MIQATPIRPRPLARQPSMLVGAPAAHLQAAVHKTQAPSHAGRAAACAASAAVTFGAAAIGALAAPRLRTWVRPIPVRLSGSRALLHAGGVLGGLSTGLLVASILGSVMGFWATPHALTPRRFALGPAVTQGMALAPLVAQGLAVCTGPAGIVALGLVAGLTYLFAPGVPDTPLPVSHLALGLIAACALGPLGWDVAVGQDPATAACRAILVGAALIVLHAAVTAAGLLLLHYAPTPYVQQFLCDPAQVHKQRLDVHPQPMHEAPTIFGVNAHLRETVAALKAKRGPVHLPFAGWRGVPVACLYGPAGTGKTLTAQGVAHALNAELAAVSSAELAVEAIAFAPVAGLNILTLIAEAELYAERVQKPVVIFVDEVDNFLPVGNTPARTHEEINRAVNVALLHTTLTFLDDAINHVMVIFATNHVDRIAPALGLLTVRAPLLLDIPDAGDLTRMLRYKCAQVHAYHENLGVVTESLDTHAGIIDMARTMAQAGLSGRDVEAMVSTGSDALLAHVAAKRQVHLHVQQTSAELGAKMQQHPEDIGATARLAFFARLNARLATTVAQAQARGPRPPVHKPQAVAPRSMREFLRDAGLHVVDVDQLIRFAAGAVMQSSADPSQHLRLTQVGGRALRAASQLVARATTARPASAQPTPRDFNDVPRR